MIRPPRLLLLLAAVVALLVVLVPPAGANEQHPTLAEIENEVYCPICHEPLAASSSPIAQRMRAFIRQRIGVGQTKSQIEDALVREFGEGVLAAPPKRGFNLLAWLLPLFGLGFATVIVFVLARGWLRSRAEPAATDPASNGRAPLDPEIERRLDEELARFDG
ncbi:MAG: cytochrome c-type biogenesis protein CcmH [Actinobacteria bacterium]|nr:MAG: cytochrome c-type biogenesis protein CcmH [Actinomycetota bacterium]